MSPSKCFKRGEWIFRIISSVYGLIIFTTGVLLGQPAWAGGVVASCTESALRVAMAGGGTVNFACDGTITLASTITNTVDAVLDGSGHQVTISGNNAVRVFYVATNVNFTVVNLTIAGGQSTDGAGVFNSGGMLILFRNHFLVEHRHERRFAGNQCRKSRWSHLQPGRIRGCFQLRVHGEPGFWFFKQFLPRFWNNRR